MPREKYLYKHTLLIQLWHVKQRELPISKSCQGCAAIDLRDIEERILSLRTGGHPARFPVTSPSLLAMFSVLLRKTKHNHNHPP